MLNLPLALITLLAAPTLVASILSQAELWQRKEYRLDRLLPALVGPELRARLFPYMLALIFALLGAPSAALLTLFAYHLWRFTQRGLLRPKLTTKAAVLSLTTAGFAVPALIALLIFSLSPESAWAYFLLLVPLLTVAAVIITNVVASLRKQQIIRQANSLRLLLPKLEVIGITGSYGKTSTKHFLSQLLPEAAVTKEHRNAEFPVAQDMLEQLNQDAGTYIVEMGAYKKGEITALTELTRPQIGVITAIGNQHLATFGSQENILKGKWELIESLPKDGVAVLNADDKALERVTRQKQIKYSTKKAADVYVDNITIKPRSITCNLHIEKSAHDISIPLVGQAALAGVVAAVAAAHAAGAVAEDIIKRVQHLKPYPQTMQIKTSPQGATVIDDSYSANELGVLNAIAHLKRFSEPDKRIVLVPLIELGPKANAVHQRIGQALAGSDATVFIYGTAYQQQLTQGNRSNTHVITKPQLLVSQAAKDLTKDTVMVLAGRVPSVLRDALGLI